MEITLPSGLRGTIRGMRGREAQAFVDPALTRNHRSMDTMLANCWLETADAGPYTLVESKSKGVLPAVEWPKVLLADRFQALIEIRALTFGQTYDFHVKCEGCEARYGWELELEDLPRKALPDASREKIKSGANRFTADLPDGKVMIFKLATGVEEVAIARMKGGAGSTRKLGPVDAICIQAIEICARVSAGGERPAGTNLAAPVIDTDTGERLVAIPGGLHGIRRYLEDQPYQDLTDLHTEMQAHDGGIETKIETVCENCGWQQEIELPFQRSFFERRPKKTAEATGSGDAKASGTGSSG